MTRTGTEPPVTFDPIWEEKYQRGEIQRYPWDIVVSFVFRHAPRDRPRQEVLILEVGCGTASNLWFAAREGFSVAGIDGSAAAIEVAKRRFQEDGLAGELVVGDFTEPLPFASDRFDLAIDRGALVCTSFAAGKRAVAEIRRTLKRGGLFFFNPYSQAHSSFTPSPAAANGFIRDVRAGALAGLGQACFYDEAMIRDALGNGWQIEMFEHAEFKRTLPTSEVEADWRVIACKM